MPKIKFTHINKTVDAKEGEWLFDSVQKADGCIPFSCKAGVCGTCATQVLEGRESLSKQSSREIRTLTAHQLDPDDYRLLCTGFAHGDLVFGTPYATKDKGGQLRVQNVIVESYRPLNATVAEIRFFVEDSTFAFQPGQFMVFRIHNENKLLRRSYSISTAPSEKHHFEVCVRAIAGGSGSNYIHSLRPGDEIEIEGPCGDFVLQEKSKADILMIATGTGIAPIKSMLLHLLDIKSSRNIRLFFGLRHESDLFYTDLYRGLKSVFPEFEYHIVLSAATKSWSGQRGRVTDLIDRLVKPQDANAAEVYLCGGRKMIEDCKNRLKAKGFAEDVLHHENFY